MARPRLTERSVEHNISLPEKLAGRLALDLYSESQGRVPHGAYKEFFTNLLTEHYARIDAAKASIDEMNRQNQEMYPNR